MPDCNAFASLSAGPRRRRILIATVLSATLLPFPSAFATADAQALLAASDAIRNPSKPFRVTVTLTEFEKGVQVDSSTLFSYARTFQAGGQFASIMRFVQPLRDAGKVMLKNGSDLWLYDPGTKASIRISPQQRLVGQASNGDVVTVNFARDYRATLMGEEAIQDGERHTHQSFRLHLASASPDATYGSIDLWVDATSEAPLKARFFSESGRLLKTAYYRRFQNQLGAERPTETVIIDGLQPQAVTIVRLTDYAFRDAPPAWFQRDFLPSFTAD
jgi:outer membrane lipoprotein-sorting protein